MNNWEQKDWEVFFKALSAAISSATREYAGLTDKSMIGNHAFKIAYGVAYESHRHRLLHVENKPKNFNRDV